MGEGTVCCCGWPSPGVGRAVAVGMAENRFPCKAGDNPKRPWGGARPLSSRASDTPPAPLAHRGAWVAAGVRPPTVMSALLLGG